MPVLQPSQLPVLQNVFDALIRHPRPALRAAPKPTTTPARDARDKPEADQALDLVTAIQKKDLTTFERLLKQGVKPFVRTRDGRLPLVEAALVGNMTMADRLVQLGADPRDHDGLGRTAMGVVWLQANGGPELDTSIAPRASGQASRLLTKWQTAFPVQSMNDFFSVDFRERHMSVAQQARLDLEPSLQVAFSDQMQGGGNLPWDQVLSETTLAERQHQRRARLAGAPEKDPTLLPMPTHPKSID
jgi:hypothetical protein